ncbi:MAG: oligosaccharide flippase family protein [Acidobacteriota bacterium]|nr:oligosaccharide flippase family protein [Acidobacteriota bacterium]
MQLRIWHIARGVLSNWFAMAATLAVGFFLQPYIVHRLGDVAYGVWVLAVSSVSYMIMLDLGMATSVLRFISKGHATQDHQGASEALSAVLWVRLQISALILVLSGVLAAVFPAMFKVPPGLASDARKSLLIIGFTMAISMSFGIFSATLSALNRYDLRSYVTVFQLVIRVVGVVTVLRTGHGILAIAFCELLAAIVGNAMLLYLARRIYPELEIQLGKPKPEVLRKIWSYSVYAFLITVAVQLVYQSDNLVVGAFVSASAVTYYSIGNTLCRYTQQFIGSMTATFCPAASTYEAAGDLSGLRALYFNGTRATLAISLPIVLTLIIRGHSFIGLWMGAKYAGPSGAVLVILAIALLVSLQNLTAGSIALGIEKHKVMAWWAIGEGVANLALSIVLGRKFGLNGVAIGTLVPSVIVHLLMWPNYVSRLVDVSFFQVYWNVWGPVFFCGVPFAVATYAVNDLAPARNMIMFMLQTAALLPVFVIAVALMFWDNVRRHILPKVKSFLYAHAK